MPEFTPEIVAEIVKTCQAAVDEASAAFGRALDLADVKLSVGKPANLQMQSLGEQFAAPGLVVVLSVEDWAALLLLPEEADIVPQWCADPDPTGQSKLQTLAQELGMTLLPERFMPSDSAAGWVENLSGAVARGDVADGATMLPLELSAKESSCTAMLIWPAAKPSAVLDTAAGQPAEEPVNDQTKPVQKPQNRQSSADNAKSCGVKHRASLDDLPNYSRSLLKIEVPVVVTLAEKRQPLGKIIELGPGSIIHFEKSCEEMLDLEVGGQNVATGEAVKIGDKFGLRITSMVLPEERFRPVVAAG